MSSRSTPLLFVMVIFVVIAALAPKTGHATIVRFETVIGDFEVNLYDNDTPETVANFLSYVQNGDYTGSFFHRSLPGFVLQGGGFRTDVNSVVSDIPANPNVVNEPVFSNLRGSISMAKQAGDPNSANSQWFINLDDNSVDLDTENGGFTVFGEVTGTGMDVIDSMAALPVFAFQSALNNLPLRNFTDNDYATRVPVDNTHLILVTKITVIDTTVDSAGAAGLNPTLNATADVDDGPAIDNGGGGGGSLGLFTLFCLLAYSRKRSVLA